MKTQLKTSKDNLLMSTLVLTGLVMATLGPLVADADTDRAIETSHSVVDPALIRSRLHDVRRDGFAWTDQELDLDVNGLAVPVRDDAGRAIAIATLYGPAYRLSAEASPDLGLVLATFVTDRAPALLAM